MDFSLTTMFVVPASNSLPSTGGPQDLTAGQLGVFNNDYTVAGAGSIANKPYIYIAQGRTLEVPGLGTKISDKISKLRVTEWYKVVAEEDRLDEILEISDITVPCGTSVSVTLRLHSNYIDSAFFNGLTRTVTVLTPCCDCAADPCTDIDPEATADLIVEKINADSFLQDYVTATRTGSGTSSVIRIQGKELVPLANNTSDPTAFPYMNDRLWFRAFIYEAPATSQDDVVPDRCDAVGTVTYLQRSTYPHGSGAEIQVMERRYFSYQAKNKHIFKNNAYNEYVTEVDLDKWYDLYVIKYKMYEDDTWYQGAILDETVIIAVPTGEGSSLETLLEVAFGAAAEHTPSDVTTTTTTTSTSSTTSTSTTILQP